MLPKNSYGLLLYETISNYEKNGIINPVRIEFYEDNIKSQQSAAKKLAKGFDKYESYIEKIESLETQDNIILKEIKMWFLMCTGKKHNYFQLMIEHGPKAQK